MKVDITNLRNIKSMTFEIPDGKVSLLTGSSGSGKSSIAVAINGEFDSDDARAGADPSTMKVTISSDRLSVKTFNVDTERRLYADELSSGVYAIVMANDDEYENAKNEFEHSVKKIKNYEDALVERRAKINTLFSSTKTAFKKDGDFTKRSMIGSARSALLNSPSQRIELIQNVGGKYLTWLIDGVSFSQWRDEKTCPFCLSNTVSQERIDYLDVVTDTTETKGFDYIPTIESSLRAAGVDFGDLYDSEEFASAAKQVAALNAERQAIDALLAFLHATSFDLRENNNLLDSVDPSNEAYQQFKGLDAAIRTAQGSSTRVKKAFGKMRGAFCRIVQTNQKKINDYLRQFDIPYSFKILNMSVESQEANYLLVHNDSSSNHDFRKKLSYGERNVIALIFFLLQPMNTEDLIIIDDPVSSYDEYRREQIYKLIIDQDWTNTVLLLSHDHVFAKYALFHYRESKRQQELNRSLSSFDKHVLKRTGEVLYLVNENGFASTKRISVDDYDTMTHHILNRLQTSDLSYYQQVINLRLFYECSRNKQDDKHIYSYLSAVLHAPKADDFEQYKQCVLSSLSKYGQNEADLLNSIKERTGVLLSPLDEVTKQDIDNREGFLLIENIAALREIEENKEVKAEMSDLVHMNAALVYCLNPYKFYSCSRRLLAEIDYFTHESQA